MALNLGPTINLSGSYNTQRNQLNFAGIAYTTVGSTFSLTPTTYNGGDYYLALTGIQAGTYTYLIVGNYIVGTGIPNGSKIVAVITTNSGAGTGTYQMSCSQPQGLGTVSGCSAATGALQNYGQVVATAPTYGSSAYKGQLDFYAPATNKTYPVLSLTNGNVGVANSNPLSTMDVSGTVSIMNGNLAIGTTNGLVRAGVLLDVSGAINLNGPIGFGYSAVPTFTSNQIGYSTYGVTSTITSFTTNTFKNIGNFTIPAGVWLVSGVSVFLATGTGTIGRQVIEISTNNTGFENNFTLTQNFFKFSTVNGDIYNNVTPATYFKVSTSTTYYLNVLYIFTGTISVYGTYQLIRIA